MRTALAFTLFAITLAPALAQEKKKIAKKEEPKKPGMSVIVENDGFLPVQIKWKPVMSGDKAFKSFSGNGEIPVEGKELVLILRPLHRKGIYQWACWWITFENEVIRKHEGINSIRIKPSAQFKIRVSVLQQAPTWGGAVTRYKKALCLVAITTPDVIDPWTKLKIGGLSKDLAQVFLKGRTGKGHWGKFSANGVSLHVPSSTGNDVPEPLRAICAEELAQLIRELLEIIQFQRPPDGTRTIFQIVTPTI